MNLSVKKAPLGIGSTFNGIAYYCDTIDAFLGTEARVILERLLMASPDEDYLPEQEHAWKEEIRCLQARLSELKASGYIVFEYNIVRMAKRIDVVLLLRNVVYSLEFKVGQEYTVESMEQALDYALRLRNFHKMSNDMFICPILIATKEEKTFLNIRDDQKTIGLQKTNDKKLGEVIKRIDACYGDDGEFDFNRWFWSAYHPSPSIIEAAIDAFNSVPVASIARSEAGQEGIDSCVACVHKVIEYAQKEHKKCLCFVTGVPGAGKTLVGLDVAAQHSRPEDDLYSVYISGNKPLVSVLQEALARAWLEAGAVENKNRGIRRAASLIQHAYTFRNAYLNNPQTPTEHILIFDEAQRVWNKEKVDDTYLKSKQGSVTTLPHASEAELAIRFMDRHEDWAVIVCLVGLGQDIHNGEVGVYGWFHPLLDRYRDWEAFYAPALFGNTDNDKSELLAISRFPGSHEEAGLHLSVSVRSFRAEKVSEFINELVENRPQNANKLLNDLLKKYPIFVTRNLSLAKEWVTKIKAGTERIGVIASSMADEILQNGIKPPPFKYPYWPDWFLSNDSSDERSSNSLTMAATEFDIQGLEIDWAVVAWGADFQYKNGAFVPHKLTKRGWIPALDYRFKNSTSQEKAQWMLNAYRVNLTRARQGMVIYVPQGCDSAFESNYHGYYDDVFAYLTQRVGIPELSRDGLPKASRNKMMLGPTEDLIATKLDQLKMLYETGRITLEDYNKRKDEALDNLLAS